MNPKMYKTVKSNKIVLLLSILILGSTLDIFLPQIKKIDVEVDHIYQKPIPSFFQLYQSSELKNFARIESPEILIKQSICTIQDEQDNQYIEKSQYFHSHLADPEQFYLGRKKIASFDDLMKLTGIIDTIKVDDKVIVLFQNGFYTSYEIDGKKGKIKAEFVRHIQSDANNILEAEFGTRIYGRKIGFGDLLHDKQNPEYVVFFGQQQALIMNKTSRRFEILKGYNPMGQSYEKAIIYKNNIFVGSGLQGVFVYEINYENKEIKLKQSFRPFYKDGQEEVYLTVSELGYNEKSRELILVDQSEGIYWSEIPIVTELKIECKPKAILMQNCENINLMLQTSVPVVIATCPQLLIVTLDQKRQHLNDEITFYPQSVVVNQSRILLFGENRYAVYDLQTSLVQQGESPRKIEFAEIIQDHIIIVNTFAIYSGRILPDQEKILCNVNRQHAQQLIGTYQAVLQIQGICSQLYSSDFIQKTNLNNALFPSEQSLEKLQQLSKTKQNCFLKYNIEITIRNSAQVSYLGQIITVIFIGWILIGGMIAYCVKDIKINKEYNQLLEENNVTTASEKDNSQANQFQDNTKEQIIIMK